ncbi:MAG: winged helix-turn-helix transcriptional regulator [Alphaproteobacteria bacterium]|nr:winged helix-turn-helix transcriptional regulator [Alphaproteobacteria bacterium]
MKTDSLIISLSPEHAGLADLEAAAVTATRLLKMLANEQRLIMLCRLAEGEASVGELAERASLAQSAASQHLGKLRAEGVVATRRDAQTVYYRLADASAARLMEVLCDLFAPADHRPARAGRAN